MPAPVDRDLLRFLQAKLPEWLSIDTDVRQGQRPREGMRSIRAAAEELGLNYNSLNKIIHKGEGAGPVVERLVADRWFNGDRGALDRAAQEWARANPVREVIPVDIERVLKVGARLGKSAADAIDVSQRVAALTGTITDEEIAALFDLTRERLAGARVEDGDDLGRGLAAVPKLPPRGGRR